MTSHRKEPSTAIGKRFLLALTRIGRTNAWLANRAGLPEETISRVISGASRNPQINTIQRMAYALGVTVGWVLEESTAPLTAPEIRVVREAISIVDEKLPRVREWELHRQPSKDVARTQDRDES